MTEETCVPQRSAMCSVSSAFHLIFTVQLIQWHVASYAVYLTMFHLTWLPKAATCGEWAFQIKFTADLQ